MIAKHHDSLFSDMTVKLWQPATTTTIDPECEENEELDSHVLTHPDSVSNSMRRSFPCSSVSIGAYANLYKDGVAKMVFVTWSNMVPSKLKRRLNYRRCIHNPKEREEFDVSRVYSSVTEAVFIQVGGGRVSLSRLSEVGGGRVSLSS
ncbi:unnamed protein product [Porites lobata]|uniref:Uncharacterized protein n=1 Tax=Porites lobata TaxID=104759 RepID=A0ABN8N0F6_9CNID|nr:unnamed protein product [Porites lobata]